MADWNAKLYLAFEDERTRPARELLARVPLGEVAAAVDLGCGPGNSTELLAERWPGAALTGIDTSPAMLRAAEKRLPAARFVEADVATWQADEPLDLVFANAVLQWVGDHRALLPRLFRQVRPGGVLAVQMPDNLDEPSHRLMRETAAEPRFAQRLGDAAAIRERILPAETYYDLLAGQGASVDIWRTTYHHVLDGADAIVSWLSSTGLRPFLAPLDEVGQAAFLDAYRARIAAAYPKRPDGRSLLAFPRLFIVARRNGG
jgi:trans-aconitate 2-methyltransferase